MSIRITETKEDSALIKRKKSSVIKKYSPTRSKSIEEANDLTVYLFSLGRIDEALAILKSYSENSPFVESRYERWEASCFAMLLQSHIEKLKGNSKEHQRLLEIVDNDSFNPSHWVSRLTFNEFMDSIEAGIDHIDGATKNEKMKVRVEGFLVLLNATYFWCNKWEQFIGKEIDIEKATTNEINKIKYAVL